jgi:hypothetical protein
VTQSAERAAAPETTGGGGDGRAGEAVSGVGVVAKGTTGSGTIAAAVVNVASSPTVTPALFAATTR